MRDHDLRERAVAAEHERPAELGRKLRSLRKKQGQLTTVQRQRRLTEVHLRAPPRERHGLAGRKLPSVHPRLPLRQIREHEAVAPAQLRVRRRDAGALNDDVATRCRACDQCAARWHRTARTVSRSDRETSQLRTTSRRRRRRRASVIVASEMSASAADERAPLDRGPSTRQPQPPGFIAGPPPSPLAAASREDDPPSLCEPESIGTNPPESLPESPPGASPLSESTSPLSESASPLSESASPLSEGALASISTPASSCRQSAVRRSR